MKRTRYLALLFALATAASCGELGPAYGDANSIIAVMTPELWEQVSDDLYEVLEPTIQTVRSEKAFTVTHQDPEGQYWGRLRRFRQMLVVGTADDAWVAEALEAARQPITEPGLRQIQDVWSRGQVVTLLLLEEANDAEAVRALLPEVHERLDRQYRAYVLDRMFMTGRDTALADTLSDEGGFRLTLPTVYRWRHVDSVYVFRNDNPDPSELIREIAVTWRTPDRISLDREGLLAWRAAVVEAHYNEPQDVVEQMVTGSERTFDGRDGYEVRGMWANPPELNWPAGGPFFTRLISCPDQDRVYLLDGWLYAPGKEKYEYMIQLETILDSFDCGF